MEVLLIIFHSLPADIRKHYEVINANVEDHSVVGLVDFRILPSALNTIIMSSSVVLLPAAGLFSRK
ncbi:hypothetical protein CAEBREN_30183 [Caenorhabditis brenneri]|uniref:Uncharacterized protein n=1 Tax=Caenorhabditis brenneri TaxID=135651 RepID=G0MBH2_CAEBE|nr:hypothetical protein CAEBREN_30183 [Caenorhabditis brenneri]